MIDFLVESLTFFGVEAGKTTRQQIENLMKDAYEQAGGGSVTNCMTAVSSPATMVERGSLRESGIK